MKLNNVRIGEQYIIKSLDHTHVRCLPFDIGDVVTVYGFEYSGTVLLKPEGLWSIHHKDLKRIKTEVQDAVGNAHGSGDVVVHVNGHTCSAASAIFLENADHIGGVVEGLK
jgi:hypothetical protein